MADADEPITKLVPRAACVLLPAIRIHTGLLGMVGAPAQRALSIVLVGVFLSKVCCHVMPHVQNGKRSRTSAPGNAIDVDLAQLSVDLAGNNLGARSPLYHMESETCCLLLRVLQDMLD
jgi:hypothetical protein